MARTQPAGLVSFSESIDMNTFLATLVKSSRSLSTAWFRQDSVNSLDTALIWAVHVRRDCRIYSYKWEPNVV